MNRYTIGITILVIIVLLVGAERLRSLRVQRDAALAEQVRLSLRAEGFKEALAAKPREILKLVPTLVTKEVVKLVKEGKVEPIAAAAIEASTDIVVPCPPSADPNAPPPAEVPLHLTFTADLLITRIKFGIATEWKGDLGGSWERPGGGAQAFAFEPKDTKINIAFSDEIAQALYEHEREGGWLKRHTALMCPGVGLNYNPLDPLRPLSGGIQCAYGFVWL